MIGKPVEQTQTIVVLGALAAMPGIGHSLSFTEAALDNGFALYRVAGRSARSLRDLPAYVVAAADLRDRVVRLRSRPGRGCRGQGWD